MISKKMSNLVKNSSAIRAMFEEGRRMAEKFGKENVYDYSLGNPSVPAPEAVNRAYAAVAENPNSNYVHGYMLNQGFDEAREAIAKNLNERFPVAFTKNDIVTSK